MKIAIFQGEKKIIHKRRVYDFMAFLGDAGGIYGSMMIIGAILNFCLTDNEQSS